MNVWYVRTEYDLITSTKYITIPVRYTGRCKGLNFFLFFLSTGTVV